VIARQSVWSHPEVLELVAHFVPAADEVGRLQRGQDVECRLFQEVAEQGHYAGRAKPSATRQGTYAIAPNGVLLTSWNNNNPEFVASQLRNALKRWEELSPEERLGSPLLEEQFSKLRRPDTFYPEDGLALRVHSRDLPREIPLEGRWANSWNQDYAWFRQEEAVQFLPDEVRSGQKHSVPEELVHRLARFHFVDHVRGETPAFPQGAVREAALQATVENVEGPIVSLKLEGHTRTLQQGSWPIRGFRDMESPTPQERGVKTRMLGAARFNLEQKRFTHFELVALGTRHGGTQYNGRSDDLDPAPIGFLLTLASDAPAERVAPAFFWSYGWR
jgi:hypothetical protein